ncbi:MAG: hypothetical protein ACI9IN_001310, partial [Porticoccaceae bacterium]
AAERLLSQIAILIGVISNDNPFSYQLVLTWH